jgi:hypothetical protein
MEIIGTSCSCKFLSDNAYSKMCEGGCKSKAAFLAFADSLADIQYIENGLRKSYEIEKTELRSFRDEKGIWTPGPAPRFVPEDWGKTDVSWPIGRIFRGKVLHLYEDKWILIYCS